MNYKLTIATVIYLVIISLLIRESYFDNTAIKDIALITSSFATLIIALSLYDRYNYRKIIFEKKLDAVLKLLENIKATQPIMFYRNVEKKIMFSGPISIDRNMNFTFLKEEINLDANILFQAEELSTYFKEMAILRGNPFMPNEIVQSLNFLNVNRFDAVKSEEIYQNEHIKLAIRKSLGNIVDLENWYKPGNDVQIGFFLKEYVKCLDAIENWINKHSDIRSELNI